MFSFNYYSLLCFKDKMKETKQNIKKSRLIYMFNLQNISFKHFINVSLSGIYLQRKKQKNYIYNCNKNICKITKKTTKTKY